MSRRMDSPLTHSLRLAVYWVTIVSLVLTVSYAFVFEIRDALNAADRAAAIKKAIGASVGLAFLIYLAFNPPE